MTKAHRHKEETIRNFGSVIARSKATWQSKARLLHFIRNDRRKTGFSLLELIVVLVILGFLVAMMAKVFTHGDDQKRFDETRTKMGEIKKALIGASGAYANGQRQFSGYIIDMGRLPELVNDDGTMDENGEGQPKGLWTRDLNDDGDTLDATDIPETLLWEYQQDAMIWMGWRGPYIESPPDDLLEDAWGDTFAFIKGDIVKGTDVGKFYRCKASHKSSTGNKPTTGTWEDYWEEVGGDESWSDEWFEGKKYFNDSLNIISRGADNRPDGDVFDEDILLKISHYDYMAPVAGKTGRYVKDIAIYFPSEDFNDRADSQFIGNLDLMAHDSYFKFESDVLDVGVDDTSIPIGVRSVVLTNINDSTKSDTKIFAIEPTGNWLGTLEIK